MDAPVIQELSPEKMWLIPFDLRKGAMRIVQALTEAGHEALFVGGVVRDLLLGNPIADVDIATSASPSEIEAIFRKTVAVGKQFGVMVVVEEGIAYEVATFRSEEGYTDGRHPGAVRFTNAEQDAWRRDFTVNGLFLDSLRFRVIDYVGGLEDLDRRVVRTIGDPGERLEEDKLRVLRTVRFACQLGFQIDSGTFTTVKEKAERLLQVSWERIRDEVLRILTGPAAPRGLDLMWESGILNVILPEVAALHGVPQPPEFHPEGDVFEHTRLMFQIAGRIEDANLALAVLLHDIGKPPTFAVRDRIRFDGHDRVGAGMAEAVCRRLRLANEQTEEVVDLVRDHLRFIPINEMRESTLKRFLRKRNIRKHLALHRLDCLASHGNLAAYDYALGKLYEFSQEELKPAPFLTGHDLIALGLRPGPVFSEILGRLEDLQLEGRIKGREEALAWVRERYETGFRG